MKKKIKYLPILGLVVLMNCASNVRTKKYSKDDFNNFKTFAYLPNTALNTDEFNKGFDRSVEESLVALMNEKMVDKGFSIDKNEPDLVILLTTSDEIKSNLLNKDKYKQPPTRSDGGNSSSPNYTSGSVSSLSSIDFGTYSSQGEEIIGNKAYKKGTLIVEVFNRKSKELLWVGIAENFVAHISDQTLMSRMISEIFEEFPG